MSSPLAPFNVPLLGLEPQPFLLIDMTGTATDDEPIMRAIWKDLAILMGIGDEIDWDEVWEARSPLHPERRGWHGIGDGPIFDDLAAMGLIGDHNVNKLIRSFKDHYTRSFLKTPDGKHSRLGTEIEKIGSGMDLETRLKVLFALVESRIGQIYEGLTLSKVPLRKGIQDIFNGCAREHWPKAPVTNDPERIMIRKLYGNNLRIEGGIFHKPDVFPFYIGPEAVNGRKKPDPDSYILGFKEAIKQCPGKAMRFVVLEDSNAGIAAAHAAAQTLEGTPHAVVAIIQYKFKKDSPVSPLATWTVWEDNVAYHVMQAMRNAAGQGAAPGLPKSGHRGLDGVGPYTRLDL